MEDQELKEVGDIITGLLQDINSYMRMNSNSMGELRKTTLRVGKHEINIVVGMEVIKASVKEVYSS